MGDGTIDRLPIVEDQVTVHFMAIKILSVGGGQHSGVYGEWKGFMSG